MMSEQAIQQLDRRLSRLEAEVRQLKKMAGTEEKGPWWERIAGRHKGDRVSMEIDRLGRRIREAERAKARGRGAKQKAGQNPRKTRNAAHGSPTEA
jgi:hypothetical protein